MKLTNKSVKLIKSKTKALPFASQPVKVFKGNVDAKVYVIDSKDVHNILGINSCIQQDL